MPPIGRVRLSVCFLSFHWTSCVRVTAVALRRLTDQGHRSEVKAKIGLSMQICVCYMSIVCSVLSVVVVGFQLFTVTLLTSSGSGRFRGRSDIDPRRRAVFSSAICERFCASLLCSVMTWDHLLYHAQCKCKGRFVERIKARNLSTAAQGRSSTSCNAFGRRNRMKLVLERPCSRRASNALRVPTAPQTRESLCCSEAVDIQDDERLQRCCG